jgi:hypothetical protein
MFFFVEFSEIATQQVSGDWSWDFSATIIVISW